MLRIPGKPMKIAFKILGIPANIKSKRTEKQKAINKQLVFQETSRVR